MRIKRSRIAANVSLVDRSVHYGQWLDRIRKSGVKAVEFWWPFLTANPTLREVAAFVALLQRYEFSLVAMNLFGGKPKLGDRGVLMFPEYAKQIEHSVRVAVEVASETGCTLFNVPVGYGDLTAAGDASLVVSRLRYAADQLASIGGSILLEALTDDGRGYPLTTLRQCSELKAILDEDGTSNFGLLLDTFHLDKNGFDISREIRAYSFDILHVQIADSPGRGTPGSGPIDFVEVLESLAEAGYGGAIACEFTGLQEDEGILDWVDGFRDIELVS